MGEWGMRADGTPKGQGYFGTLQRPDGKVSTELSIGVNFDGKEVDIPALVPTLSQDEIKYLLNNGKPTKAIVQKAVSHARNRMSQNKNVFAQEGEQMEELSPAVRQFTNNPAMAAITAPAENVRQFTDNLDDKEHPEDWEYLPNISQRNDPDTIKATGGDRAEAAVGGYGYSGDPAAMGDAIDFAKRMEDTYAESIAREKAEKQKIIDSEPEEYDIPVFIESFIETHFGGKDPRTMNPQRMALAQYAQEERALFESTTGLQWGYAPNRQQAAAFKQARQNRKSELFNMFKADIENMNKMLAGGIQALKDKQDYEEDVRKEATRKKELEESRVESKRRYEEGKEGKAKGKPTEYDKKRQALVDRYGPNSLEVMNFELGIKAGKEGKTSKLDELKKAYPNVDDQTLMRIAAKTIKVVSDPVSGNTTLVDIGTGETIPMTEKGVKPTKPAKIEPPKQTIWQLSGLATGPVSTGLAAGSVATGLVGAPVAEKTLFARQFVEAAQNDLIRSLSINPRFPATEIKRLQKEINLSPAILDNPKMMQQRIKAIDTYLRWRLKKEIKTSQNVQMPKNSRQNALSAANDIKAFLTILGAPQGPKVGTIKKGYRFKGGNPADKNSWEKVK